MVGKHIIGREVVSFLKRLPHDRLFILCDRSVRILHRDLLSPLFTLTSPDAIYLIQGDETHKNTEELSQIWQWLLQAGASRQSVLITIGGGVVSDIGGFAAATYMRGIRTVNLPTTLLSMVDASIGGKTAIDFGGVKNIVGAFHQPTAVFTEVTFLSTLSQEQILSGYAEVIKHSLLMGEDAWRETLNRENLDELDTDQWIQIIERNQEFKASIVEQDPEEKGLRRMLNLGHTIGHALEAFSPLGHRYKPLEHGYAIAIGLQVELYLACLTLGYPTQTLYQLRRLCRKIYPHYHYACKDYPEMIELMQHDKKNDHGIIRFVALSHPGKVLISEVVDPKHIEDALDFYRETFAE